MTVTGRAVETKPKRMGSVTVTVERRGFAIKQNRIVSVNMNVKGKGFSTETEEQRERDRLGDHKRRLNLSEEELVRDRDRGQYRRRSQT